MQCIQFLPFFLFTALLPLSLPELLPLLARNMMADGKGDDNLKADTHKWNEKVCAR